MRNFLSVLSTSFIFTHPDFGWNRWCFRFLSPENTIRFTTSEARRTLAFILSHRPLRLSILLISQSASVYFCVASRIFFANRLLDGSFRNGVDYRSQKVSASQLSTTVEPRGRLSLLASSNLPEIRDDLNYVLWPPAAWCAALEIY